MQRRLLSETDLTFKKVFELAQPSEVAEKNSRDLHKPIKAVHAILIQPPPYRAIVAVVNTYHISVDSNMPNVTVVAIRGTWLERVTANLSRNSREKATPRGVITYTFRGKVEQELERLEWDGIIQPVQFSIWAALIVPVVKRD